MTGAGPLVGGPVRAGVPLGRDELSFAVPTALVVVVTAQLTEPGSTLSLTALTVAAVVFVARFVLSSWPSEVFSLAVVVLIGVAVAPGGRLELGLLLVATNSLYAASTTEPVARATLVPAASVLMLTVVRFGFDADLGWPPWTGAVVLLWVLGRSFAAQRRLIAELEATRRAVAETAVAEERRRMARELHDVAGHALAGTLLHLTGARHVLHRDLDEAERALRDAERAGRDGMDRIRAAVTALRTTERATDAPLADTVDLDGLLGPYLRAGLDVTGRVEGDVAAVRGASALAVNRIVGEALANATRHAPGNRIEVRLAVGGPNPPGDGSAGPGRVRIEVRDRGTAPGPDRRQGGFGLIGMQERARGVGGRFLAGPTDDGWLVEAEVPIAPGGVMP